MCADRLLPDTRLQDFMHENLCLKHGIKPSPPSKVMNKITYAKLFERFNKVSGMTGTAQESASSFWEHYNLSVCAFVFSRSISHHRPMATQATA